MKSILVWLRFPDIDPNYDSAKIANRINGERTTVLNRRCIIRTINCIGAINPPDDTSYVPGYQSPVKKEETITPKEQQFEIWSEGYRATGDYGTATYHGTVTARTFRDAVKKYAESNPRFKKDLSLRGLTLWGCKLFDNESDARKSFG